MWSRYKLRGCDKIDLVSLMTQRALAMAAALKKAAEDTVAAAKAAKTAADASGIADAIKKADSALEDAEKNQAKLAKAAEDKAAADKAVVEAKAAKTAAGASEDADAIKKAQGMKMKMHKEWKDLAEAIKEAADDTVAQQIRAADKTLEGSKKICEELKASKKGIPKELDECPKSQLDYLTKVFAASQQEIEDTAFCPDLVRQLANMSAAAYEKGLFNSSETGTKGVSDMRQTNYFKGARYIHFRRPILLLLGRDVTNFRRLYTGEVKTPNLVKNGQTKSKYALDACNRHCFLSCAVLVLLSLGFVRRCGNVSNAATCFS